MPRTKARWKQRNSRSIGSMVITEMAMTSL